MMIINHSAEDAAERRIGISEQLPTYGSITITESRWRRRRRGVVMIHRMEKYHFIGRDRSCRSRRARTKDNTAPCVTSQIRNLEKLYKFVHPFGAIINIGTGIAQRGSITTPSEIDLRSGVWENGETWCHMIMIAVVETIRRSSRYSNNLGRYL